MALAIVFYIVVHIFHFTSGTFVLELLSDYKRYTKLLTNKR